ncbi:MAG: sigma 54-interacting transcriptional regulator [Deltaproteobacteria bacterium]|nr:sigma 54-interacting transcriptional regulator [Deltaproteobacteria bacterium]MBW1816368.1 sigma 54-interacting transcriptional regulator [Deltaproteobacteria bacterium]MBW2285926.1 sigma 54-interacting transcriptional regulator [Deltaproteobacteria bacterium]
MLDAEYNKYWKTVIETMPDGLMIVDPDGIILSINDAFKRLTGYTDSELIGRPCEVLGCNTCFDTRARGGEKHCQLFKDHHVRHSKCILKRKDGRPLHVLKNANVLRDEEDQVVGGVETLTDCTELVAKEEVISTLRRELDIEDSFEGIIGRSAAIQQLNDLIQSAANSEAPVVIYGESGTGKELVAAAIHHLGVRRKGPFIKVNCAALNEALLESELFGHIKGAFTGAERARKGRFEAASKGDLFLDEIGDLPLSTQVKLLRVLQEKEIERVGDHKPIAIDVRIITATNKDLQKLMKEGRFRDDLYYRVGVIPIHIPPLRDRPEDIPLLIETFISRIRLKSDKRITGMEQSALKQLTAYDWPGNVRELINVIEYAFVLCPRNKITRDHLPATVAAKKSRPVRRPRKEAADKSKSEEGKRARTLQALTEAGGNKSEAARILGISRVTLWKRLKQYDIQVDKEVRG